MAFTRSRLDHENFPTVITEKWRENPDVLREGFIPLPKRVMRALSEVLAPDDGLACLQVILAVVDYRRPGQDAAPSPEYLAHLAGLPLERFMFCLEKLTEKDLIKATQREGGRIDVDLSGFLEATRMKGSA